MVVYNENGEGSGSTGQGVMFKRKKNVDRHGLRPLPVLNNPHLAEPPCFSLYTTFTGRNI
jgi:hypothetical protein